MIHHHLLRTAVAQAEMEDRERPGAYHKIPFARTDGDGAIEIDNNAAERAMRPVATGRRNWTFAGSDEGGRRAAAISTLIETAKLNDTDPLAWLADLLARLQDHPAKRIDELMPWNWRQQQDQRAAA